MNVERVIQLLEEKNYNVVKADGRKYGARGECIIIGNGNIRPCFYLSDIEKDHDGNYLSDDEIVSRIINTIDEIGVPDYNFVFDFDKCKDNIMIALRQSGYNDRLCSKPYLDLESYLYIDTETAFINITEDFMRYWNIDKDYLFELAIANTEKTFQYFDFNEFFKHNLEDAVELYSVYCGDMKRGASCMMFPDRLKEIADKCNDDLWLFPDNVDFIIAAPTHSIDYKDASELFKCITSDNSEIVPLSDHIYKYNRKENKIIYKELE